MRNKHRIKSEVAGKLKEVEEKVTGGKTRELEGRAQRAKGEVKSKATKVREDLKQIATKLEIEGDPHALLDLDLDCRGRNRANCRSRYS